MNILVLGSGAREHAIVWKLLQSPQVRNVWAASGNAGTGLIARNLSIPLDGFVQLAQAVVDNRVDLVIVGPEDPLAEGVVDFLSARGIPAFGPTKAAARIESSKSFAKELMLKHDIPCARGETFDSPEAAKAYIQRQPGPMVVKADGLAAGKGVTVALSQEEALKAVESTMEERVFGEAGDTIIIEEFLTGNEVSLLAFTDGETVVPMTPARDYKRAMDGDEGPNTGGMGCYSPPYYFGGREVQEASRSILEPAVRALAKEGYLFKGVLYAGLMVTPDGPKVVEFNARFGDPETQVILPRLETDLVDIMQACINGSLHKMKVEWSPEACVGVVLASGGYPADYMTGLPVTGLDTLDEGVMVFHAGTRVRPEPMPWGLSALWSSPGGSRQTLEQLLSGGIETSGGRVLTVVSKGGTVAQARERVYQNVPKIRFAGCAYRSDIAAGED